MRYKKPKYSNNYKKFNKGSVGHASSSKRKWIILGVVAAIVLAIVVAVAVTLIVQASNAKKAEQFNAEIKEIQIVRNPNKLSYYCGAEFDSTGMLVYTLTNGGTFAKVDLRDCTITGFDSSVAVEEQTLTVTYKGFTDTLIVKIKDPIPSVPMLVSIAMETLPKTEFKYGEAPDIEGGTFVCTYSDGSTKTVELQNENVSGFGAAFEAGKGEHDITVQYIENGIQATTTYKITLLGQ